MLSSAEDRSDMSFFVFLFEVLFYIANQTGIDAQYYDGDRIKSVAR